MKVKYVNNESTYLISNHAVARNAVFRKPYFQSRLKYQIIKYLSPICEIKAMKIHPDQFQVVVKLASREVFESYFKLKNPDKKEIPESTYIFSQVMANLQSSIAIHFNRKENRTGAVFARRFVKIKIKGRVDLLGWIRRLKADMKLHHYVGWWLSDGFKGRKLRRKGSNFDFISLEFQGQLFKTSKSNKIPPLNSS